MKLEFTKMQGAGNDFIVLNGLDRAPELDAGQIRQLADRHYGIGCDQLLLIEPATDPEADIRYRIFNPDGGEAQQCGNGARCIAEYLHGEGRMPNDLIRAETTKGMIRIYRRGAGLYTVDMGLPELEPDAIPMRAGPRAPAYTLKLEGGEVTVHAVSMGNPHAVVIVDEIDNAPVATLGPEIQQRPEFPEGVNVGFMQVLDRGNVRLRVYERGAGETLACGSGACAAVVAGIIAGRLDNEVAVGLKGGTLGISWEGEGEPVWMSGPAAVVYKGWIEL